MHSAPFAKAGPTDPMQTVQGSEIPDDIDSEFAEILDGSDHIDDDKRIVSAKYEALSRESQSHPVDQAAIGEHLAVLQWLQDTAPALPEKQYTKGEWRYSRPDGMEERSRKIGSNLKTTTMMDIDDHRYPQKRKVQHQGAEFNKKLTKSLFDFVRRGQIKEAIKMCDLCDEPGQSAGLYGFLVHNKCLSDRDEDLNLRRLTSTEATARNLWEMSCRQIARDNTLDVYERATYAALCGDMENTLPACTTWEDLVWAYYNASVENLLGEILMPDFVGSNGLPSEEAIFSSAQRKDIGSDAATQCFHQIQALIITNQIEFLVSTLHEALVLKKGNSNFPLPDNSSLHSQFLRFATLFILYLTSISAYTPNSTSDSIISEYIKFHFQFDAGLKAQLVALYCSKLSNSHLQAEVFADFLNGFDGDRSERALLVEVGEHHQLDMKQILRNLYQKSAKAFMQKQPVARSRVGLMNDSVSPETLRHIRTLEWLTFERQLYADAITQTNNMIRHFLAQGDIKAAQIVFTVIPASVISSVLAEPISNGINLTTVVKELRLHDTLVDIWGLYNLWETLRAKRPAKDDTLESLRAYRDWASQYEQLSINLVNKLQYIIRSNWCRSADDPDQIIPNTVLREMYIPELVLNLHQILYYTHDLLPGHLEKSLQISDMVADDDLGLGIEFVRSRRMGEFVQRIQQSSVQLLKQKS
ncbi:hypothetical protein INT43_007327 [Umbelopsis isabellina]|uniref:Nuclear pore complex protein n=1 Tax=Mortierella isabellina TaxID=91625 RepID=A0A8H7PXX0_MORIS|nr:hypothetical protein INT43_007327 [Umbelopsis isabellina]